jgi:thymidylate synthase ThyX
MGFGALIHADSRSPDGVRLTTFEISFPRCILAELNTHRMLSKSSASSRAIPVEKMLKRVMEDPYIPTSWGKNQKGMQAEQEVNAETAEMAKAHWFELRNEAVWRATMLRDLGIHKQITNRLLEPWLWHTCIVTGTEWSNFFHLRNNPQASPDFQTIAAMMQELYEELEPEEVDYGEWHMPLVGPEDYEAAFEQGLAQRAVDSKALMELLVKVSVARCARVSYLTHDGKRDLQADLELHDRLLTSGHMSPFEHAARPLTEDDVFAGYASAQPAGCPLTAVFSGNFRGWLQYRKLVPNEEDILAPR